MPQLVKGGKFTYGWSRVGDNGRIIIPPLALVEYHLKESEKLILFPGSQKSRGFGLGSMESFEKSPLGRVMDVYPELGKFPETEGQVFGYKGKPYCWVGLHDGSIVIPTAALENYGIKIADKLLVIRGSSLALGFAVRGLIVEEAKKHRELKVFEP
jgi:bifunctional DNA-binding transcriptional regulator/antitoxin component of YhaV-PrlF toxin-antitoxin module